jgi:hypothetical protein
MNMFRKELNFLPKIRNYYNERIRSKSFGNA